MARGISDSKNKDISKSKAFYNSINYNYIVDHAETIEESAKENFKRKAYEVRGIKNGKKPKIN